MTTRYIQGVIGFIFVIFVLSPFVIFVYYHFSVVDTDSNSLYRRVVEFGNYYSGVLTLTAGFLAWKIGVDSLKHYSDSSKNDKKLHAKKLIKIQKSVAKIIVDYFEPYIDPDILPVGALVHEAPADSYYIGTPIGLQELLAKIRYDYISWKDSSVLDESCLDAIIINNEYIAMAIQHIQYLININWKYISKVKMNEMIENLKKIDLIT